MFKTIYLLLIKCWSTLVRKKEPVNVVYLLSFSGNEDFITRLAERIKQESGRHFTVFYRGNCGASATLLKQRNVNCIKFADDLKFVFQQLKKIMGAQLIFVDNYFAFLGGCAFDHKKTTVVQLWHANGAVKTFGWEEPRTKERSVSDKKRFQKVYDQFDDFVVGSTKMGEVFCNSYHQPSDKMKVLGYPRTDQLFAKDKKLQKRRQIFAAHPELKNKEIILYAPTYRETVAGKIYFDLPQNFIRMLAGLNPEQTMILKLHPLVQPIINQLKAQDLPHVVWVDDFSTEDLLLVSQRLITDYSSVIFDYTLLENAQQIVFYCYDYEEYAQIVGIQHDFAEWAPGKIVTNTTQLKNILAVPLRRTDFTAFNHLWNKFNDGHSSQHVLEKYFYGN